MYVEVLITECRAKPTVKLQASLQVQPMRHDWQNDWCTALKLSENTVHNAKNTEGQRFQVKEGVDLFSTS